MGTKKVEKTGVYRNKAGHSVFLRAGEQANEALLADYEFDGSASKDYAKEPERSYFSSVNDAPQNAPKQRAEKPAENRAEPPLENRSDAELAAAAAKSDKA